MTVTEPGVERSAADGPARAVEQVSGAGQAAGMRPGHRIWGLDVVGLHDRFWASRGVQVVRQGEPAHLIESAELYMLMEGPLMTLFDAKAVIKSLYWAAADAMLVRIHDARETDYHERVVTREDGAFVRIQRVYGSTERRLARVALTTSRDVAALWQQAAEAVEAWRDLRRRVPRLMRSTASANGTIFIRGEPADEAEFVRSLVKDWSVPSAVLPNVRAVSKDLWAHVQAEVSRDADTTGPVWVGAGRALRDSDHVSGPAVLWDDPASTAASHELDWAALEPTQWVVGTGRIRPLSRRLTKRAFDITFATVALLFTGWIFPLVMLAIWLEDQGPFFFGHERESLGGRRFNCWKFRSMRKDAEEIKKRLRAENQADGPQFFMENDPRLTRVGRFIRKTNIDELPQFWNVLMGEMSIVGPRPSPYNENQFNPTWREARLSVLPGITGLWQVRRTRRKNTDFQEWIRFDIEYVETASFGLDMRILLDTVRIILGLKSSK